MKRSLVSLSALALAGLPVISLAADDELQEVLVTAQKRSERLQDVPAAITALSGDSLNDLHLQGNQDLARSVPSLSFDVLGPGESTLAIRGLGTAYGLAPAVSYYLNEVPLDIRTDGYAGAPDIDFFDVDRVEVLRGPQGTLYGSSSMGGALRILTAQPDPSAFAVNAELGGSSLNGGGAGYAAKSAVNLPLTTTAAVRLVGTYEHIPGYINQVLPDDYSVANPSSQVIARRVNDADIEGGRLLGLWKPTSSLTIAPSLIFSRIRAGSNSNYFSNLPDFTTSGYYPNPQSSRLLVGNLSVTYDFGVASLLSSTSVLSRDVDTSSDFTLFFANIAPLFGLSYPPNTPGTDHATSNNAGVVQEFRLSSPTEGPLHWVAGAYFSRFRQHSAEFTNSDSFAAAIGQTDTPNIYSFNQSVVDRQLAVFADVTYKILPQLELRGGERYYELRDSLENVQSGVIAGPNQPLVHAKASGSSPRVVLSYYPVADTTLYVTAARGYRPGGPNVGLPQNIGCGLTDAYSPLYSPDSVWNYEFGTKNEFWQRRLSVNVAAYQIDWKNVQQAITDPGCGALFVANVGTARSRGVELEINFKPVNALLLSASGSYNHAQYQLIGGPFRGAASVQPGDAVPDVPRQKVNLAAEYSAPIATNMGYLHLDWSHLGTVPTGFTYHDVRPAYNTLQAALGLRTDHYDISLYGHNLTNTRGILSIQESSVYSFGSVFRSEIATPPRTVGIDLKLHF